MTGALPYIAPAVLAQAMGDPAAAGLLQGEPQRAPGMCERTMVALRLASPKRADPARVIAPQADAGHLPLFIAADEPRLF